jgi:molybdopterin/thiamine biosynthesis adenylyltransferase
MDQGALHERITLVGAGGTGCALLPLLLAIRPSHLRIIDGDTVEEHNLHRQPLYGPKDVGLSKTLSASARIAHQGRGTELEPIPRFIDVGNARELLQGSTVVADCTDDLHARMLLDRVCAELRIPLVSGAVHGQQIQVLSLHTPDTFGHPGRSLRDWFPRGIGAGQDDCDMREVPAAVTTIAAACMAMRIQAVLSGDHSTTHLLDLIDARHGNWMRIHAPGPVNDEDLIAGIAQARPVTQAHRASEAPSEYDRA